MPAPIQFVVNSSNYQSPREASAGGGNADFFGEKDKEFVVHKKGLLKALQDIARVIRHQESTSLAYLKVTLRMKAWAKSHRPIRSLFTPTLTPLVGGDDLGEMIFEVTPEVLEKIVTKIKKSEEVTRLKLNASTGKEEYHPTRLKSETGAIESVRLYESADKRRFSVDEGVAWLGQSMTGSAYDVKLFEMPPPRNQWDAVSNEKRLLFASFVDGIAANQLGLSVQVQKGADEKSNMLSVRIGTSNRATLVSLTPIARENTALITFDPDMRRHKKLLEFLDNHPLVRTISLPGYVVRSDLFRPRRDAKPSGVTIPLKDSRHTYPSMGVIDGGISNALSDWVLDRWDLLASTDIDTSHGTFIGGLGVVGKQLNTEDCCRETDGINLVDLAVLPSSQGSFRDYYPEGLSQFFDEVEAAVSDARSRHGVRIFNMSLNVVQPVLPHRYSSYAARIDRIADKHDALLFISAGNLPSQNCRPEWPYNSIEALGDLAQARDDSILSPAESIRNVAVAAVNPVGDFSKVDFAPAAYSRRGPGIRVGNKPDLAQVGGYSSNQGALGHGLFSVAPDGTVIDGCGTSYAAPLVAKTAAALAHSIEGEVSRETLIGLLVHHASLPEPLLEKSMKGAARHLVGFGVPATAQDILSTNEHSITLIISTRIKAKQQVNLHFPWPKSLVNKKGACRGSAKLTVVASPPIDERFGAEFIRVNVEGALQQQQSDGTWLGKLDPIYLPGGAEGRRLESELVQQGLKWGAVKVYEKALPRGTGESSNWRLAINYLTRGTDDMPVGGVPFTAILTISDVANKAQVFDEMRQSLTAIGVQIADIRTAARITPRV